MLPSGRAVPASLREQARFEASLGVGGKEEELNQHIEAEAGYLSRKLEVDTH